MYVCVLLTLSNKAPEAKHSEKRRRKKKKKSHTKITKNLTHVNILCPISCVDHQLQLCMGKRKTKQEKQWKQLKELAIKRLKELFQSFNMIKFHYTHQKKNDANANSMRAQNIRKKEIIIKKYLYMCIWTTKQNKTKKQQQQKEKEKKTKKKSK